MADLTPAEATALDEMRAKLHAFGYVDIEQHGDLRPGTRIRHAGQRWPEAYEHGTGVVLALTERPNSAWSLSWGRPDIEMVVLWDRPWPLDSRLSQLAQYHVAVVPVREERTDA